MNCDHFWTCPLCSTPCEKLYKNTDFWTCPYCPAWAEPGGGKRMGQVSPRNFPECQPGAKKVMVPVRAAYRNDYTPTIRSGSIGFRCALRGVRVARV